MDNDYVAVSDVWIRRTMFLFTFVVIIFCVYLVVSAIITAETTGVLKVSSTQKATISVSKINSQAENIGQPGKAGVRLKPGTYEVVATTSNGQVAARQVTIKKKRSTNLNLMPTTPLKLPSVDSVSFFGMSALTDLGINDEQVNKLELDFFHFKTSAGAVSIDTQSVKTLPYVLGNPSVITFNVAIDSQTYAAKITYADMQNIQLQLYDRHNGQLLFDSTPTTRVKNLD